MYLIRIYKNILGVLEIDNYRLIFFLKDLNIALIILIFLNDLVAVYINSSIIRIITRIDSVT